MKRFMIIFASIVTLILTGCEKKVEEYSQNFFYMDTYINVKLYNINKENADKAFNKIDNIYEKYQNMTNVYDENSEVYKINNSKEKKIEVSSELLEILNLGNEWYDKSNGLFNINMGNLIKTWKTAREEGKLPSKLNHKITKLKIEDNYIKNSNVNIDLGAIAKGYATELVGKQLQDLGIEYYLINAGGNILVGKNAKKGYYTIGIEDPLNKSNIYNKVRGENISVVTSGGYERFFEVDNVKYHHIIDPTTKYPAKKMLSATVITKSSTLADILSTTLFLYEPKEAIKLVESLDGVEAILYVDENTILKSSGFKNYEQK
jgi:thiamine biosynthesis lipoprotein